MLIRRLLARCGLLLLLLMTLAWRLHAADFDTDSNPQLDAVFGHIKSNGNVNFQAAMPNGGGQYGVNHPGAVVVDPVNHRLWVADADNGRVLMFGLATDNTLSNYTADAVLGKASTQARLSETPSQTNLVRPVGLALDSATQTLYVADAGACRVLAYAVTTPVNGMAAFAVLGQADFVSGGAGATAATFSAELGGLAYHGNRLFACDSGNNRLLVFDVAAISNGEAAANVLGQANFTANTHPATTQSSLNHPAACATNTGGTLLFIADQANSRVVVHNVAAIADGQNAQFVLGQADFTSFAGATTQNGMKSPAGVAFHDGAPFDRLFVSDLTSHRVTVYDVTAIANGEAATHVIGQAAFVLESPGTSQSTLRTPGGLAVDTGSESLWIADNGNSRVLRHTSNLGLIANGQNALQVLGQTDGIPDFNNGGPNSAGSVSLNAPRAVALDPVNHRLFIGDTGNYRVVVHTLDSQNRPINVNGDAVLGQANFSTVFEGGAAGGISANFISGDVGGIAVDAVRNLAFVSCGFRVLVYDATAIANGEAAVNVIGQADFLSADPTVDAVHLDDAAGVAYDAARNLLYVADAGRHRVLVFDMNVIANGEAAVNVLGQANFAGSAPGLSATQLNTPSGLAYDAATQILWVADSGNHRVLGFNLAVIADGEAAAHVLGQALFTTAAPATSQAGLRSPTGLGFGNNRLFVGDAGNHRLLVFDVAAVLDGEAAINVIGQANFTAGATNADLTRSIEDPIGIAVNAGGNGVYVADPDNNRIDALGDDFDPITSAAGAVGGDDGGGGGGGGGGCFIATASLAEGGEYAVTDRVATYRLDALRLENLNALRRFRDETLQASAAGRGFIAWYYSWSPAMAHVVRRAPAVRWTLRNGLIVPLAAAVKLGSGAPLRSPDVAGLLLCLVYVAGAAWACRQWRRRRLGNVEL